MMRPSLIKWALDCCDLVATRSRDPSTKVGAVILRPDKTVASVGYNGFPRGVSDAPELYADRDLRLMQTVHAEMNAILSAHGPVEGCTLYVSPLYPCAKCAGAIIQAGIKKIVYRMPGEIPERWKPDFTVAAQMFREAGVITEKENIDAPETSEGSGRM